MTFNFNTRRSAVLAASAAAATAAALLIAGCSSPGGGGAAAAAAGPQHTASRAVVSKQQVRVEVRTGPQGTHLADGSGKSLYLFASDTASKSMCSSACLTYWPPLIAVGRAQAVGAVKVAGLGTVTTSDGRKQVTYDGHRLYYYVGDTKAGDVNGQGLDDFGAHWWLLTAAGKALTGTASGSSGPTYTGRGGY